MRLAVRLQREMKMKPKEYQPASNRLLDFNLLQFTCALSAQLLVISIILFFGLRLWSIDLSVPFNYWGDTVWFSVPIKGMIDNGWVYTIPQLSAPFALNASAFPSMTHTDWLVMKLISLFANEPGTVLNVFWFSSIVFTAWSTALALSLLGARLWLAAVAGLVYAFLPFALLRNVAHISLVYYCVPLLSLFSIWVAQGCTAPHSRLIRWVGIFAAIAQGFDYIYYSFFALLLFGFAGWFGSVQARSWHPLKQASIAGIFILFSATINLTPSFLSWQSHGKPPDMAYKSSVEAEIYGLKLRKLLAPNEANRFPVFSQWAQRDKSAGFPLENENVTARLGPMAAAGLLLLLMVKLRLVRLSNNPESEIIRSVATLSLFVILFSTIGGLGAIFNLAFVEFRTYNRFSVFVAFFALTGIIMWWQSGLRNAPSKGRRLVLGVGLVSLVLFTLYDQLLDLKHLRNTRTDQEIQTRQQRDLVKQIETIVPPGSSVFQLPLTGFPPDGGINRMATYAHGQAFLASTSLHWSWPSFSQRHRSWQDQLNGLEAPELVDALALSKFRLIWVDRFGYSDNGEKMVSSMISAGAKEILTGASSRYVVLDLENVINRLRTSLGTEGFERNQRDYLEAPGLHWGKGFYPLEKDNKGRTFHWSQRHSELVIRNWSNSVRSFEMSFLVAAGKPGKVNLSVGSQNIATRVSGVPTPVTVLVALGPGETQVLRFTGDMGRVDAPSRETRDLHFYVMNMQVQPTSF